MSLAGVRGLGLRFSLPTIVGLGRSSIAGSNPGVSLRTSRQLFNLQCHISSHIKWTRAANSLSGAAVAPTGSQSSTSAVWSKRSTLGFDAHGRSRSTHVNPFLQPYAIPGGSPGHAKGRASVDLVGSLMPMPDVLSAQLGSLPVANAGHVRRPSVLVHLPKENETALKAINERAAERFQVRREALEELFSQKEGIIDLCIPSEVEGKLKLKAVHLSKERLNLKSAIFHAQFSMKQAALNGQGKAFVSEKRKLSDLRVRFGEVTESLMDAHRTLKNYQKLVQAPQAAILVLREAERARDIHILNKADKSVIQGARDIVQHKERALREAKGELGNFYAKMYIVDCKRTIFKAKLDFLDAQMDLAQSPLSSGETQVSEKFHYKKMQTTIASAFTELSNHITPAQYKLEMSRMKQSDLAVEEKLLTLNRNELFAKVEAIYRDWQSLPVDFERSRSDCEALFDVYWNNYKENLRAQVREELNQAELGGVDKVKPQTYAAIKTRVKRKIFAQKVQCAKEFCSLCPGFFSAHYLAKRFNRPVEAIRGAL